MKKRLPTRGQEKTGRASPKPKVQKATILLVDDDAAARKHWAKLLEGKGYRIIQAGDGEEALALSVRFPDPIRLLISDVMMPVMNGKDLAERLCSMRPEIRILFVSGYTKAEALSGNGCSGKEHWLAKPFTAARLISVVERILGSDRGR